MHRRRAELASRAAEIATRLDTHPSIVASWLERAYELGACEQLDLSRHTKTTRENVAQLIRISGLENLAAALELGRGAILYSGHVYGLLSFFVALAVGGHRVNMITLPENREQLAMQRFKRRRFEFLTENLGIRPLRLESSNFGIAIQARNALRRNELVTIVIDQSSSRPQIELDFLGGRASFPTGIASLAETSNAPLLPFWIGRSRESCEQVAEIGAMHFGSEGTDETVRRCVEWIESRVLDDPASWSLWLNPACELVDTVVAKPRVTSTRGRPLDDTGGRW